MKALPLEKRVDCDCDFRLALPVVTDNPRSEANVKPRVKCGRVECSIAIGDEPRAACAACGNTFLVDLPVEWREWLGCWRGIRASRIGRRRISAPPPVTRDLARDLQFCVELWREPDAGAISSGLVLLRVTG